MNGVYVFDLEGDGLTPTLIHCVSVMDESNNLFSTTHYAEMRTFFRNAKILICHNAIRFDKRVVEKLLGIKIKAKVIDTLALSWVLYPDRPKHGLESWGLEFKVPKPYIHDWNSLKVEDYIHRCEEDVKINKLLWDKMYSYLYKIYNSKAEILKFINYIAFKMECAAKQEDNGWLVDIPLLSKTLSEMEREKEEKIEALTLCMPKVPIKKTRSIPVRMYNKQKTLTKIGTAWIEFLKDQGLPPTHTEDVEFIDGYDDPNPASTIQIKDWLYSLGWVPETFDYKRNKKTGELRKIPQINLDHGEGICPSIKKLYSVEPNLEVLDGLSVLNHRIPLVKGIIESSNKNNYSVAAIQGLTNTLRFKHKVLVNLPGVDKPWGEEIRGALTVNPDEVLCGADKESLEDKIKQHFIYKYDPGYVEEMNTPDYDPHIAIAITAGAMTGRDKTEYKTTKEGKDKWSPVRKIYKSGNYACQYGAGVPRLMLTCGVDKSTASTIYNAYWEKNKAIKQVMDDQLVRNVDGQDWLYNPISGFWYTLRHKKDIFSTLVQGTASYVFDLWLGFITSLDTNNELKFIGQFHDEIVIRLQKEIKDKCTNLLSEALDLSNSVLKLNVPLKISVMYGTKYSEIH